MHRCSREAELTVGRWVRVESVDPARLAPSVPVLGLNQAFVLCIRHLQLC